MKKSSCVRLMIMKNCPIREIFMTQKNPVVINCLYSEIFMTKNRVS